MNRETKKEKLPYCPKCNSILYQYYDHPPMFQCTSVKCFETNCGETLASKVIWKEDERPDFKETRCADVKDLFTITCKRCKSKDVDLSITDCPECGITINAECNSCGQKYDYHNFKKIEVD